MSAITRVPAETAPGGHWRPWSRAPDAVSPSDHPAPENPEALLVRLRELAPGDANRGAIRAQVIEWHLPMAAFLARRFDGRGQPLADLTQVAAIGLIKAVDRFDPHRGVPFASFAFPTILGEIKRHFRDTACSVRIPRRLQELKIQLAPVTEDLGHTLHRPPTTAELAERLGVSAAEVLDAQRSAYAYACQPLSFDYQRPGGGEPSLSDSLGGPDPELEAAERRETLRTLLAGLPERDRRIIALRFVAEMTQSQIAADLGLSQMQISRLLARSLTRLRGMLVGSDGAGPADVPRGSSAVGTWPVPCCSSGAT